MSSELVKRLRSMHWCVTTETNGVGVSDRKVALEAADRISALQAQNLRLSGMCYDLTAERDVSNELGKALEEDAGQLRAERDRLRAAIETISYYNTVGYTDMALDAASAALKGETP